MDIGLAEDHCMTQHGITLQTLSSEVDIERLFSLGWDISQDGWDGRGCFHSSL
jgi:hypothetical protein